MGGDELLRFGNPNLGSELCTAVKMMFSLEKMLEITGDVQWAGHLERVTFNALPTQITDDFSARQYYHQIRPGVINEHFKVEKTPVVANYPWTLEDAPITIKAKDRPLFHPARSRHRSRGGYRIDPVWLHHIQDYRISSNKLKIK